MWPNLNFYGPSGYHDQALVFDEKVKAEKTKNASTAKPALGVAQQSAAMLAAITKKMNKE